MVPSLPSKTDIVKTQSGVLVLSTIQLTILGTKNNRKRIKIVQKEPKIELRVRYKGGDGECLWHLCEVKPTGFILCHVFESPLYFCFVAGLDKVHLALLRSYGGKIWQSCLIMVALILLHFSLFSVKFEFHHCNLERIFGQPHFSWVLEYYR